MGKQLLIIELKRTAVELKLIDRNGKNPKASERKEILRGQVTQQLLSNLAKAFIAAHSDSKTVEKEIVIGCFYDNASPHRLGFQFSHKKFNGLVYDASSDFYYIDKHELVCLNDFSKPSSFFEFNEREIQPGQRGLVVSVGNHLQAFEEHSNGKGSGKSLIRIDLGSLSFSPHTDLDHEFGLFVRQAAKRTVKYSEFLTKDGFKLVYLFFLGREKQPTVKEPSFKELLQLIADRNALARRSTEFFIYLLGHFLYSGLMLLMLDKELILTGNFLRKVIAAYGDDKKIRRALLDNLVLANHVKHTFDHLRISLQTNINDLVTKSVLENF
jgi:hypothetical protein